MDGGRALKTREMCQRVMVGGAVDDKEIILAVHIASKNRFGGSVGGPK